MTEAEQENLELMLWSNEHHEVMAAFDQFKQKHNLSYERHSMFPVHSEFRPSVGQEAQSQTMR